MRFMLHYRGPLRSNGSPSHKHDLRIAFHSQLKRLWSQPPLVEYKNLITPPAIVGDYYLPRPFGPFVFLPLVTAEMNVVAELSLVLLRPESPGHLITQGGDIDNRLKTLFDALTMPRHANSMPPGVAPSTEQTPYFCCLLEDDNLVTALTVKTEQMLETVNDPTIVDLSIHVRTRTTRVTIGNPIFA
jgi:hypothetical protein